MSDDEPRPGARAFGRDGKRIGTVDALFVDYLLIRTTGLPVDLYVPRTALTATQDARVTIDATRDEAYERWHRPLKQAPHS